MKGVREKEERGRERREIGKGRGKMVNEKAKS